jgi:4-diphosphocytidyl-2-C-methyl-D-erythritol kinase
LAAIKKSLYDMGAYYAAMSGSGSTIFGLFENKPEAIEWNKEFFVFEGAL